MAESAAAMPPDPPRATPGSDASQGRPFTLRDLRRHARDGRPVAMLTCYEAVSARHLAAAGVKALLVGDTAAEMVLGHGTTLPVSMPLMLELTAAVRRGAPHAMVMADMPFGSYQCGQDEAMANAVAFLKQAGADCVKLEVEAGDAPLIERMVRAGVPVVAHIGSRPQRVKASGGYASAGRTRVDAERVVEAASTMLGLGVSALLIEAVPDAVSERVVAMATPGRARGEAGPITPVIGCGAGPACHGHVVVLHDLLGLTGWQPPFVTRRHDLATPLREAAADWVRHVEAGDYLRDGGVYRPADE